MTTSKILFGFLAAFLLTGLVHAQEQSHAGEPGEERARFIELLCWKN